MYIKYVFVFLKTVPGESFPDQHKTQIVHATPDSHCAVYTLASFNGINCWVNYVYFFSSTTAFTTCAFISKSKMRHSHTFTAKSHCVHLLTWKSIHNVSSKPHIALDVMPYGIQLPLRVLHNVTLYSTNTTRWPNGWQYRTSLSRFALAMTSCRVPTWRIRVTVNVFWKSTNSIYIVIRKKINSQRAVIVLNIPSLSTRA